MEYKRFKKIAKKVKSAVKKALFIAAFGATVAGCGGVYNVRHAKPYIPLSSSTKDRAYFIKEMEMKWDHDQGSSSQESSSGSMEIAAHLIAGSLIKVRN